MVQNGTRITELSTGGNNDIILLKCSHSFIICSNNAHAERLILCNRARL